METIKTWLKWLLDALKRPKKANTAPALTVEQPQKVTHTPHAEERTTERHKVAGISYREEDVQSLGVENSEYNLTKKQLIEEGLTDERVYKTDFYVVRCCLIPEPENPEDPKAIKVVADDVHIGYIKKGSCARLHKLLREDRIKSVSCEIRSGPYKIIRTDYNEDGDEVYEMEHDTVPLHAVVTLTVKNEAPAS